MGDPPAQDLPDTVRRRAGVNCGRSHSDDHVVGLGAAQPSRGGNAVVVRFGDDSSVVKRMALLVADDPSNGLARPSDTVDLLHGLDQERLHLAGQRDESMTWNFHRQPCIAMSPSLPQWITADWDGCRCKACGELS